MEGITQCGTTCDLDMKRVGTVVVKFENEPEVSTADSRYEQVLEVIGNKSSNNNDVGVIQDVKLVLKPSMGTVSRNESITTNINKVYAGKCKAEQDHDTTKPVTVDFGNIKGNEKRLVLADLFLPKVSKEVNIDSLQIFCYYRNETSVPTKTNPVMFRVKRCKEPKETPLHKNLVEIAKHELLGTTGPIISKLGPYGSQLSETYSVTLEGKDSIKEVTITYGFIVDAIQFLIKKPNGRTITHSFGGKGGEHKKKVPLKRNEYITQISGKHGNYIHQNNDHVISSLNIHTNLCPFGYGSCGYNKGVQNVTSFSSPLPTNGPIVGFWGRSGNYLESIGIFVRKDC